jgi:hypothetical protein
VRSLFGMETEPVVGGLASKWHAVELEIGHEPIAATAKTMRSSSMSRCDRRDCPVQTSRSSSYESSFRAKTTR